jgi:putative redox protein
MGDYRLSIDNGRGHHVICDLPPDEDGSDTGPTPLELGVMALAGCAAVIFAQVAAQSKIKLHKLEVTAEAEKENGTSKLSNVVLNATVSANARPKLLEAAWRRTEANCPVLFIYNDPVPITVHFNVIPS